MYQKDNSIVYPDYSRALENLCQETIDKDLIHALKSTHLYTACYFIIVRLICMDSARDPFMNKAEEKITSTK